MSYATIDDLRARFGDDEISLVFDRENLGYPAPDAVARALEDADEEINAYLTGRYDLPLTSVPPLLTRLAAHIAMYHASIGAAMTEDKKQRYDGATKMLAKIAEGKIGLGIAQASEPPARMQMRVAASDRMFADDTLESF